MRLSKRFFLKTIGTIILLLLVLGLGVSNGQQQSKEKFPNRPITIIINFATGGFTDIAVRIMAQVAEKELGVPLIVVNKGGGGGTIGATELARAKPDGYTIGTVTTMPMTVVPVLQKVAYDPFKDFDQICGFARFRNWICTKTSSPFKSIKDVVEAARKNPGKINFATMSVGTSLILRSIAAQENINLTCVIAQGGTELNAMLLGGHVDLGVLTPFFQFVESGELRGLAVADEERWPEVPNVPTTKELGYDVGIAGWMDFAAPAGVPKERLDILYNAFKIASNDPKVKEIFEKNKGSTPYITGEELKKIYQKTAIQWKPFLDAIKAEQTKK